MTAAGVSIPVLRSVNRAWRTSNESDVVDVKRLLDGAGPEELRETTRHLALLVVTLASLVEERCEDFTFDGWVAFQEESLLLDAIEAQFAEDGDAA